MNNNNELCSPSKTESFSIVAIAGPTGGGKAGLAMRLAQETGALLISCDSMKIYRFMDIGTAKPSLDSQEEFDWRGINLVDPWEDFDSAQFVTHAEAALREAKAKGRPAILSGGTALYIKALTEGLFEGPGKDEALRLDLRELEASRGKNAVHDQLRSLDQKAAEKLHPNDIRRVIRAIEVFKLTGQSITDRQQQFGKLRDNVQRKLFVARRDREDMDRRINSRVDRMMKNGWLEECRRLLELPQTLSRGPLQAIGYQDLFRHIQDGTDLEETITKIKTKTRRFARRQITWLNHFPDATEIRLPADSSLPG
ncbi:MAG: tRNA (adenosine(37)-N6)-dimethylallyltransferase MiaA, partial [Planctomycetota bacterium]|nr:tRNA (adenosine(37)-N6)-dimethylallyltransferase MiaA [Planctomycetota bacterium]